MLFVSAAPAAIKKKMEVASQRMFLFSDNVEPPLDTTPMFEVLTKINASRGFCAKVNTDLSMSCVRSAGWRGRSLYYNYVPALVVPSTAIETTATTVQQTIFDVFAKYYSIGRAGAGTWTTTPASLITVVNDKAPTSPLDGVMILPPCDGTPLTSISTGLSTQLSVSLSSSRSWNTTTSLGIVTGRHEETITTIATHLQVTELNPTADRATLKRTVLAQSSSSYGTDNATVGPRTLSMSTQNYTVTRSPYSETVTGSSTTYSNGPLRSAAVTDTNLIYGTGSKEDTPDYALTWGMMPMVGQEPNVPMYALIVQADDDFEQTGLARPGVKPVMSMKQLPELAMTKKVLM
ncbi:hypothetical protein HOT49_gp094 [Erwinia phage vB_EamM_Alexandra]|uniref:Uncharacterized protein n=1 Tax=Erwinia phage vB_EamM_Alexandra TaxID=2201424 RepID=A0A2Z4QDM2_9CAUD|nr:hypothetical protein HOT49_gp094 [Erwinia phage vB_EamM_Alexandra]AWY08370.1 hypothetical protein Alexandra_95 [Erwinia phage vB_EamM_Alexandra]